MKVKRVTGCLGVQRSRPRRHRNQAARQGTPLALWRLHAFFITIDADVLDIVAAVKTHCHHAIIQ